MAFYLDHNADEGWIETFEYDDSEDRIVIKRSADVQPVIDRNKELANHTDGWLDQEHTMRLAASIPIEVCYIWLEKYGVQAWRKDHWDKVRALLNDPEWRYLRTNHFII